jgi:hypothetical protein
MFERDKVRLDYVCSSYMFIKVKSEAKWGYKTFNRMKVENENRA